MHPHIWQRPIHPNTIQWRSIIPLPSRCSKAYTPECYRTVRGAGTQRTLTVQPQGQRPAHTYFLLFLWTYHPFDHVHDPSRRSSHPLLLIAPLPPTRCFILLDGFHAWERQCQSRRVATTSTVRCLHFDLLSRRDGGLSSPILSKIPIESRTVVG